MGFPGAQIVKNLPVMQKTWVQSLGWEDPLEKRMVTPSGIQAWRIPWTEEPGGLQSMESQRVRHDWLTLSFSTLISLKSGNASCPNLLFLFSVVLAIQSLGIPYKYEKGLFHFWKGKKSIGILIGIALNLRSLWGVLLSQY